MRPARPEEYAAAGDVTVRAYLAGGFVSPGSSYVDRLRDAAARAAAGVLLVAVDEATGDVVGTAALFTSDAGPDWAEHAGPGEAVLRMLAVAPEARRRGVGRLLTVAAVEEARDRGCRRLLLSTQHAMTAAHALYESLGFRRAPERDWQPVEDEWLMGYELAL